MRVRLWLLPALVFALLAGGFAWIFSLRLASGDVYPLYSSLRADPLGTRGLYEALEQLPGISVTRDYLPLYRLPARDQTVFILGQDWQEWTARPAIELRTLHAAATRGARVVIAFAADQERDAPGRGPRADVEKRPSEPGAGKKSTEPASPDKEEKELPEPKKESAPAKKKLARKRTEAEWQEKSLIKEWGVAPKRRWLMTDSPAANAMPTAPSQLERQVEWHSDVHFGLEKDTPWRVLYRRAGEPVLIEWEVGAGSVVLMADAFCLSNEAMHRARATALLSWLVGTSHRVVFHEGALGVLEENGVAALARRYGLGGALALAALLAGLYAWRQAVGFVPVHRPSEAEAIVAHNPGAGLTALLRRSGNPAGWLSTCVEEWRKSRHHPAAEERRVLAAWQDAQTAKTPSVTAYNEMVLARKRR